MGKLAEMAKGTREELIWINTAV